MVEESPFCPECGDELSISIFKDDKTGKIIIEFWCEGDGDDEFQFQILTGMDDDDIEELFEVGKIIRKEMRIKLVKRVSEEEALKGIDE